MGNQAWAGTIAEVIAWTFVHSIWQGLLVTLLYSVFGTFLKQPAKRYTTGLICFSLFLSLQVTTLVYCQRWNDGEGVTLPITLTNDAGLRQVHSRSLGITGQHTPIVLPKRSWLLSTAEAASPIVFWIAVAWVLGIWFYLFKYAVASYLLKKELERCIPVAVADANGFQELASKLRLNTEIQYLNTPQSSVPATCGWIRPRVLLPTQDRLKLAGKFLDAIVLHELAHILRRDSLTFLARTLIHSVYFFHPLVRWMDRRMTDDSEKAADEIAADALGDKKLYAHALLTLEETRANALALGASGGSVKDRLLHVIASREAHRRNSSRLSIVMMFLCGMLAIMTCSEMIVRGASPEQKLLSWVSKRNLPEAVLPSLGINTSEDGLSDILETAVVEQNTKGSLCAESLAHLADAIHLGTPPDLVIREWQKLPYERLVGRTKELARFGSCETRVSIARQLTQCAAEASDVSLQAHYARAAFALLSLDLIAMGGVDAQVWILNPAQAGMLHLPPHAENAIDFAVGMYSVRGLQASQMLHGATNIPPADFDASVEASSYLPSIQIMYAGVATSQDWERLRRALPSAASDVQRRWLQMYPHLGEP